MSSPVPLLSRLRRRSLGAGWLCALLMVMKVAMATGCLFVDTPPSVVAAAAQSIHVDDGTSMVTADNGSYGNIADCWHAAAGDCHCTCMHALPLASHVDTRAAMQADTSIFVATLQGLRSPPGQNELRPPIA